MHLSPIIIMAVNAGTHKHSTLGFTQEATVVLLLLTVPSSHFLNICKMKQNIVQDLKTIWVYVFQRKLDWYITKVCKFTL